MSHAKLALVILAAKHVGRTRRFYQEAFGWPYSVETDNYCELALPNGMRLGIYDRDSYAQNLGGSAPDCGGLITATELYFYVENVEVAMLRCVRAGARVLSAAAPRDWGDVVAYVGDPDGNVIALAKPLS